jgi:very-short-patch-repair endonuclease
VVSPIVKRPSWHAVLALAAAQHGVVARWQLIELGLSSRAIKYRIKRGRLHVVFRGVYAVGRPELTRHGWWMAAVLACGHGALLSHRSAAALWGFGNEDGDIEVSGPREVRRAGISAHVRTRALTPDECNGIPATTPVQTLVDLAGCLPSPTLERAITEADKLDRVNWPALEGAMEAIEGTPGLSKLRAVVRAHTLVLTDSELERAFAPIARRAGLPPPLTRQIVNGFRVDFYWPRLGLVVETDGLRYHRTPATQARDALRDQVHTATGLAALRFTYRQVHDSPGHVERILRRVARRLPN